MFLKIIKFLTYFCLDHTTSNLRLAIFLSPIFFRIFKGWSMLHHGSVGRAQKRECSFSFFFFFFFFFEDVSNLCNRISTNQRQEMVIRNCQCNRITYDVFNQSFLNLEIYITFEICRLNLQPITSRLSRTWNS